MTHIIQSISVSADIKYKTPLSIKAWRYTAQKIIALIHTIRSYFWKNNQMLNDVNVEQTLSKMAIDRVLTQKVDLNQRDQMELTFPEGHLSRKVIPLCLSKGHGRDHFVFFAVDTTKKTIMFYDPRGWTVADWKLESIYQQIREQYPEYKFEQNIQSEQYDGFNCGAFSMLKINRWMSEETDSLFSSSLTFTDVMQARQYAGCIDFSNPQDLSSVPDSVNTEWEQD